MEYMLLIYSSEADGKKMSAAQHGEIFQEYQTFTQDLTKSGKNKGGNAARAVHDGHDSPRAQRQDRDD